MPRIDTPPDQWTIFPDTGGAMLVECRADAMWLDFSGTQPADRTEGYFVPAHGDVVAPAGVPVYAWPDQAADGQEVFAHFFGGA